MSYKPELTNDDLIEVIARQAREIEGPGELPSGYDETFGFGLLRLDSALCWLTENEIGQGWVSRAATSSLNAGGVRSFRGLPGDDDEWHDYYAEVHRIQQFVTFDDYTGSAPLDSLNVWARSRQCSGWRDTLDVDVTEDYNWAGVQPGSITATGCTLFTYFYKVYTDTTPTTFKQWFPIDPFAPLEALLWRYTYLYPCVASRAAATTETQPDGNAFEVSPVDFNGFRVAVARDVSLHLRVFDVTGRLVSERAWPRLQPGSYTLFWEGRDRRGLLVSPGVYFGVLGDDARTIPMRFIVPR